MIRGHLSPSRIRNPTCGSPRPVPSSFSAQPESAHSQTPRSSSEPPRMEENHRVTPPQTLREQLSLPVPLPPCTGRRPAQREWPSQPQDLEIPKSDCPSVPCLPGWTPSSVPVITTLECPYLGTTTVFPTAVSSGGAWGCSLGSQSWAVAVRTTGCAVPGTIQAGTVGLGSGTGKSFCP